MFASRWLRRVAGSCAIAYFACWAATATLGVRSIAAQVAGVSWLNADSACSPMPFVVTVDLIDGVAADTTSSARFLWPGGTAHYFSAERLSPFINTLF